MVSFWQENRVPWLCYPPLSRPKSCLNGNRQSTSHCLRHCEIFNEKKKSFVVNNETGRNCEWTVKKCHFLWTKIWRRKTFLDGQGQPWTCPYAITKHESPTSYRINRVVSSSVQYKSMELTFIIFGFHLISMNSVWRHFAHIKFC